MVGNRERTWCAPSSLAFRGLATATALAAGAVLSAHSAASHIPLLVGMLGLFPLFVAIRVYRARIAALCAAAWGLLLFVQLARWGLIDPTLLTAVIFAAAPACHAAFGSWLTRFVGFSPLVLGVTWFGVEFSLFAAGLPRGLFSGAPEETAILGAISHGLGVFFVGFLAAYVSATLVRAISVVTLPGAPAGVFVRSANHCLTIVAAQVRRVPTQTDRHSIHTRAPPTWP